MNMHEVGSDGKNSANSCSLKLLIGGAASVAELNVIKSPAADVIVFPDLESEARCQNGVCSLNWKPIRNVA